MFAGIGRELGGRFGLYNVWAHGSTEHLFTSNISWKWIWHILSTDTMHARNDAEETFGMVS